APKFRIFEIAFPGSLTLNNLTISGGESIGGFWGGGGILNLDSNLVINDVVVSNNISANGGGAGIWVGYDASAVITNSTISNNSAFGSASGGGLLKRGDSVVTITDSIISNNFAENNGGALYSQGPINISNTTFSNNSAQNHGGAIHNHSGVINISNSVISNNTVTVAFNNFGLGGGIYNYLLGTITINNSIIQNNSATKNGGGFYSVGTSTVNNSCISGNSATSFVNQYLSSTMDATNNWWGSNDGPSGVGSGSGDSISSFINFHPFLFNCPLLPQPTNVPIVLVPGFGGSWNTGDMISGGSGGVWKKTPFVKVYNNIKSTFIDNGGYVEGDDYFEFYYDWRKPTDELADDLKDYIENIVLSGKPIDTKVNLIGHSFGGVVSRAYSQKHGHDKVNKLVTSGSPHKGAITAWQSWSGAEIGDRWSWQWIALQLYLQIHKNNYSSPVTAVHNLSPSLNNLTPIFDFAKDGDDQTINVTTMNSFNSYLDNLKNSIETGLKDLMTNIAGNENSDDDSIEWIKLGDRSLTDRLLGKWLDGKPISFEYTDKGDLTVLDKSALMDDVSQEIVSASHVELMEESVGIQSILDSLEISDFTPASGNNSPNRNPALVFFLHSPANIKVTAPDGAEAGYGVANPMSNAIYSEVDKLLVIFDAIDGDYGLEIIGTGSGSYSLDIGQLTINGEKWSTNKETINSGETDTYTLSFNSNNPKNFPLTDTTGKMQLNLAKNKLNELKEYINSQSLSGSSKRRLLRYIDRLIKMIDRALDYIDANNYSRAYRYARVVMTGCYSLRMKVDKLGRRGRISDEIKARIKALAHEAGEFSMEGYIATLSQSNRVPSQARVNREIGVAEKVKNKVESRISSSGENHALGLAFNLSEEMLENSRNSVNNEEFSRASAQALLSRLLSLESVRLK
ncbi:MAG: alpha/beta fold hydrolase, partial [Patescibacteria group bacterium]|nr:alpha/beta fold hydrolase [Patescibacteria group bacterium]